MQGDGNGFVILSTGQRLWGLHGAAGLFLLSAQKTVLLQLRAQWTNQGGTWGLPGGARDSHETAVEGALREAEEETGIPASQVTVRVAEVTAENEGWTYTTVIATCPEELTTTANEESEELRWIPLDSIADLPLLPAFRASLPEVLDLVRSHVPPEIL